MMNGQTSSACALWISGNFQFLTLIGTLGKCFDGAYYFQRICGLVANFSTYKLLLLPRQSRALLMTSPRTHTNVAHINFMFVMHLHGSE